LTANEAAKVVLIPALWTFPAVATTPAGDPVVFVRLKVTPLCVPCAEAVMVYAPVIPFAMNAAAVAKPFASVVAVVAAAPLSANLPLAPVVGAVKFTTTPLAGDPLLITVTTSGIAKAPLIVWLCGVPLVAAITSPCEPTKPL